MKSSVTAATAPDPTPNLEANPGVGSSALTTELSDLQDTRAARNRRNQMEYDSQTQSEPAVRSSELVSAQLPTKQEVWLRAWCAVAGAWNCQSSDRATAWADDALKDFEKRFQNAR